MKKILLTISVLLGLSAFAVDNEQASQPPQQPAQQPVQPSTDQPAASSQPSSSTEPVLRTNPNGSVCINPEEEPTNCPPPKGDTGSEGYGPGSLGHRDPLTPHEHRQVRSNAKTISRPGSTSVPVVDQPGSSSRDSR